MLTLNLYLQDYNISNEWPGQWFEVSSIDDIQQAINTCNSYGVEEILTADLEEYDFTYRSLGGEGMIFFLRNNFDILQEIYNSCSVKVLLDYYMSNYPVAEVLDKINNTIVYSIEKEMFSSNEELIGYYFYELLDTIDIPETFKRYFDYESYGRDILLNGYYALLEDDNYIYLLAE